MAIKILSTVGIASRPAHKLVNSAKFVKPSFIFNPNSQKHTESAVIWAELISPYVYTKTTKWISWLNEFEVDAERNPALDNASSYATVRPNTHMKNLYLDNIDVRMENGRAYKVYNDDDDTYFDIREDQMLQAILKYGIQPGGKIGGEWIFALNHTQMKCYLVDGKEYKEALAANISNISTGIKRTKDFIVGNVYTDKNGISEYVYVGNFPVPKLSLFPSHTNTNVSIGKDKKHYFLHKEPVVTQTPHGCTIESINTVYETTIAPYSAAKLEASVKLVTDNINRVGKSLRCGYMWNDKIDYSLVNNIVWTDSKAISAIIAEMYLNGTDNVLASMV